jgi:hypothetical protein
MAAKENHLQWLKWLWPQMDALLPTAMPYIIPSCKSNLRIRSLSNASDGYILSMSIVRVPIHSTEDRFPHV